MGVFIFKFYHYNKLLIIMAGNLLIAVLTVVLWVGLWGLTEMVIDKIVKENNRLRFIIYLSLSVIALVIFWFIDQNIIAT